MMIFQNIKEDESWEVNDYPCGIQVDTSNREEQDIFNQSNASQPSTELLTPFEQLGYDECQNVGIVLQSENGGNESEQLFIRKIPIFKMKYCLKRFQKFLRGRQLLTVVDHLVVRIRFMRR